MGNLIGATEAMTDGANEIVGRRVFTAFGEPVYAEGESSRYGYAGQWGYQEASQETSNGQFADPLADLGWLHVGARYYDPAAGRFLQRDPIGIEGGLNVYSYCGNNPVMYVDPEGESWWPNRGYIRYGPSRIGFGAAGKGIYRLAFRAGSVHVYGLRGALCAGVSVAGAAAIGYGTGRALDNATQWATGTSLSDRLGNGLFRLWPKGPWSWGL